MAYHIMDMQRLVVLGQVVLLINVFKLSYFDFLKLRTHQILLNGKQDVMGRSSLWCAYLQ